MEAVIIWKHGKSVKMIIQSSWGSSEGQCLVYSVEWSAKRNQFCFMNNSISIWKVIFWVNRAAKRCRHFHLSISRYEVAAEEGLGSPPLHIPSWNSICRSYSQLIQLSNVNLYPYLPQSKKQRQKDVEKSRWQERGHSRTLHAQRSIYATPPL